MKKYKVSIIGTGYVGMPLAYAISLKKIYVQGIDIDLNKHNSLLKNESMNGLNREQLNYLLKNNFDIYSDFSHISKTNVIIICVPTPLDNGKPDISYVENACNSIYPYLKKDDLVILESTSYPGTTDEIVRPILEKSNLKAGIDFKLAFSPERIMPGNNDWPINKIDKVIGGINKQSCLAAKSFYESILDSKIIETTSTQSAEMVKLLENTYRYINLAFIFEFSTLCEKMGLDVFEIIDAASTKPIGFSPFYPSLGIGGHCIPIDPIFLNEKAAEKYKSLSMIDVSTKVLKDYEMYIFKKIEKMMENKKNILVIGISYKNNIDDLRESPSLKTIIYLINNGYNVKYYDDHTRKFKIDNKIFYSVEDVYNEIDNWSDLIIYVNFQNRKLNDYLKKCTKKIYDTQGLLKNK